MEYHDLRVLYLYEFMLGHNGSEAARRINRAFGENTIGERSIRRWYEKFRRKDFDLSQRKILLVDETSSVDNGNGTLDESRTNETTKAVPFAELNDLKKILLFEYKLGHSPTVAFECLQRAYGEQTIDEATVNKYFKDFHKSVRNGHAQLKAAKKTKSDNKTVTPTKPIIKNVKSEKVIAKAKAKAETIMKATAAATTTTTTATKALKPLSKIKIKLKFIGNKMKKKKKKTHNNNNNKTKETPV